MSKKSYYYTAPHWIMGEAVAKLKGWQQKVYFLTVRDGKSLDEAAEVLDIDKADVVTYQGEAIAFVDEYCKRAIAKGRI